MRAEPRQAQDGRWHAESLWSRVRGELPLVAMWGAREYRIRYRQSALGFAWSIAQPLALLLTYGAVLSLVLHVGSEGFPYISFAYAGLVGWGFVANAISAGFPSTLNATSLTSKVYFPREVIPLAVIVASTVDLAIGTAILLGATIVQGVGLSVTAVAIIPLDLMLIAYVAAMAMVGGALTVFIRDLRHVLPVALQVFFFATPIMYPASVVPEGWRWVNQLNPVAVVVESTRDAVLRHVWPDWRALAIHGLVALVAMVLAVAYTRSVEPRLVDLA